MAYSARNLWIRAKINNKWILTTRNVRVSESLDQLSRVAEFELAEQPEDEPVEGDDVVLEWFDFTNDLVYDYFGGQINAIEVESQPWLFLIRCTDQLSLLRRVRTGSDLSLTGGTDGDAWKAVMDYVGVTYDNADVADAGYALGSEEPVSWMVDIAASEVISELDSVFGMVTQTVGNNRVIRIPYDPTPDDNTGLYYTYTKGSSISLAGHHRTHGDRSRIQNSWTVRGVTSEINENCTATPWAHAAVSNPQLGRKVRIGVQEFQSDLIQSEDLAEAIVRRKMRITNKLPDEATAPLTGDPNVHPGTKIGIADHTYGINATPRYFLVTSVDHDGLLMTLGLAAGPGGAEGTVTTGVDKVCNDTHADLDWPGSGFDFPAFDFPPLDLGTPIDFDVDPDFPALIGGEWVSIGGDPVTIVGLVFASEEMDGSVGLACPIADVFSELDIEL